MAWRGMKYVHVVLFIFFSWHLSRAEDSFVDNADLLAENAMSDSTAILNQLAASGDASDPGKSAKYAMRASKMTRGGALNNDEIASLESIAYLHHSGGKYNKALGAYKTLLKKYFKLGDSLGIAMSFLSMAKVYVGLAEYDKSVENLLLAERVYKNSHSVSGEANVQIQLGLVYTEQEQYDESRQYFEKALNLYQQVGEMMGVASALNNLGVAYGRMGNQETALEYYFRALGLYKQNNMLDGYADALVNIGIINFSRTKYDDALHEFEEAVKIYDETGYQFGLARALRHNAEVHRLIGETEDALALAQRSLEMADKLGNKRLLLDAYEELSKIYRDMQDYKKADEALLNFTSFRDSLFNAERLSRQAEIRERFESEQKEEQIQALITEQSITDLRNKNRQYLFIAGFIIVLFGALTFLYRYRMNKRANVQLTHLIGELESSNVQIAEKNKEITDSIHYAQRIQEAILPEKNLMATALPEHFVLYKPRDIVSGDFYWTHQQPDGKSVVALADCTGHGVPGAFMSMIGNSLLNEIVVEKGIDSPNEVLDHMKAGIVRALKQTGQDHEARDGMDMSYLLVDRVARTVEFSGANQNLIYIKNGEILEVKGDKQPVGFQNGFNDPFTKHFLELDEQDTVYMLSDGYPDQFGGPRGKKFKYTQFRKMLTEIYGKPMKEQREVLSARFNEWKHGFDQVDDVCVIGLKF